MPNKYLERKGIAVPKQKYKVTNWAWFNNGLHMVTLLQSEITTNPFKHKAYSQFYYVKSVTLF